MWGRKIDQSAPELDQAPPTIAQEGAFVPVVSVHLSGIFLPLIFCHRSKGQRCLRNPHTCSLSMRRGVIKLKVGEPNRGRTAAFKPQQRANRRKAAKLASHLLRRRRFPMKFKVDPPSQ
jgi:hypothetical protein